MKTILIFLVLLVLTGCSVTAPVVAIVHDDLFIGEATGYMDRTGIIKMTSTTKSDVQCFGDFRYLASKSGTGKVRCNDGVVADFDFYGLSMTSGYGLGNTSKGIVSFTFGLTADESAQYLKLPSKKRLVNENDKFRLDSF